MNDNNNRRRPGSRMQGAGRRTYPDAAHDGPRVGRIDGNVPRARQVSADEDYGEQAIPTYTGNSNATLRTPHATLHRGSAYRAPSGPLQYKREMDAETETVESENLLAGRNPIREALKAGRPVEKLLVASGELSGAGQEIIRMAREAGAVVQKVDRSRLDQIYPAHQGMLAYVAAVPYVELNDILSAAAAKGEDPFLILLDGITDPHNLGAIVRSAECAGAHGVVIPERRAAGLTPAAAKAAAGALNHMRLARVKNLNRALEALKAEGIWVIGTAMNGEDAFACDLTGPVAIVIGSEGDGMSRLALEKCDRTVSLPIRGHIDSLNASVAAGVLMYEIVRARGN
jgi:23S rRNA (guanosine2251-2'-O)-methyltransferase